MDEKSKRLSDCPRDAVDGEPDYARLLFEQTPVGLALCHMDGRFVEVNAAYAALLGRTIEETLALSFRDITPPEYAEEQRRHMETLERTGRYGPYDKEYIHKDGHRVPVRLRGMLLHRGGERLAWSVVEDISDLKSAEAQRLAHGRYLAAVDRVNSAIRNATDVETLMSDVLEEMLSIFGCDRAWLLHPCDPHAPSFRVRKERTRPEWPGALSLHTGDIPVIAESAAIFSDALAVQGPLRYDPESGRALDPTSHQFSVRAMILVALYPKIGPPWVLGLHHCARAHVFSEPETELFAEIGHRMADALSSSLFLQDLRESEERLRTLVENAPEAILVYESAADRLVLVNASAAGLFEHSAAELCTLKLSELVPERQPDGRLSVDVLAQANALAIIGEAADLELVMQRAAGQTMFCEIRLVRFPAGKRRLIRASVTDITARKELEEQLRHAQKLQAIGTLAGGVAHDFNNLLVIILGHCKQLSRSLGPNSEHAERLREVNSAAWRAAELTHQLLAFSRSQLLQKQVIDLNEVVVENVRMLARLIPEDVEILTSLSPGQMTTRADRGQVGQVIMNLCTNARDAMPAGGRLSIATDCRVLGPNDTFRPASLAPGTYAILSVADTGVGMTAATMGRIFEPFFTTKELGKGTGLGLSVVYGIVKQSGGEISLRSEVGAGTTFFVFLPSSDSLPVLERPPAFPTSRPAVETILVVEDDPNVAALMAEVLHEEGFVLLHASNGEEALALLRERGLRPIDLVLTDVVMPKMGGVALAAKLRELRPGLRVALMSGYASETDPQLDVLQKPFSPDTLVAKVRELLGRGGLENDSLS